MIIEISKSKLDNHFGIQAFNIAVGKNEVVRKGEKEEVYITRFHTEIMELYRVGKLFGQNLLLTLNPNGYDLEMDIFNEQFLMLHIRFKSNYHFDYAYSVESCSGKSNTVIDKWTQKPLYTLNETITQTNETAKLFKANMIVLLDCVLS